MQASLSSWLKTTRSSQEGDAAAGMGKATQVQSSFNDKHTKSTSPAVTEDPPGRNDQGSILNLVKGSARLNGPIRNLPSQIVIAPMSSDLIAAFRRLNSLLLPIPYTDKFYSETLQDEVIAGLTFVATWSESGSRRLVGAIRCRLVSPSPSSPPTSGDEAKKQLYIATLGTLAPYRNHGIAQALLELVTHRAVELHNIDCVTAHVWTAHDEALCWYAKRGFEEVQRLPTYYQRLKPQEAVFMARPVSGIRSHFQDAARRQDL